MNVDRIGTFRCSPIETGVGVSRNKFPVFTAQVKLLEIWDEDEEAWHPWAEYEQEAVIFATLFGIGKKSQKMEPTLNHVQISKIFNWDGTDFGYLNDTDFSDVKFQARIEDNDPDYADKNPYVVNWIDEYDAIPGTKIKKLDAAGVKELNQQFAILLKQTGKKVVPAKAPAIGNPTAKVPEVPVATPSAKAKKGKKQTEAAKTSPKVPPKVPTGPSLLGIPEGKCTKQEAWETICELKDDACSDEQLKIAWLAAIAKKAPDTEEKNITPEQWFTIRDAVLDDIGKF